MFQLLKFNFISSVQIAIHQSVGQLVERVAAVESKLTSLETTQSTQQAGGINGETVENILARVTILENNFRLIKSQASRRAVASELSIIIVLP